MALGLIICAILIVFGVSLTVLQALWNRFARALKAIWPGMDLLVCQKEETYYDSHEGKDKTRYDHSWPQAFSYVVIVLTAVALTYLMVRGVWVHIT